MQTVSEWLSDYPQLVPAFLMFIVWTIVLHFLLIGWLKITSAKWKLLDYPWYALGVAGAILAYFSIVDRDLRSERDSTIDALNLYVGSVMDSASEERQLICSSAFPGMSFREPNLPNHPMVLPPPDQSILEQEKATVSKELEGQCLEIADAELMLHVWRSHQNWPGKVPIQDQLDYTWRAAEVGTELDFDEIRRMLETYLRDVKFDRGAGVQFPEFDNIQHYINTWTDLTERLQRGALLDWAIHRWYWVVLAAAGLRITKIWAEFKNESKKLADASRRQNPRSVSLV